MSTIETAQIVPEPYRGRSHLRRKECAAISGLSIAFFDRAAYEGSGPPYAKLGNATLYPVREFFGWLEALTVQSTSEADAKRTARGAK